MKFGFLLVVDLHFLKNVFGCCVINFPVTSAMDNGTSILLYDLRKSGTAVKECKVPDVNSLNFLQNCRYILIWRPGGLTLWDLANSSLKPHDLENASLKGVATDAVVFCLLRYE